MLHMLRMFGHLRDGLGGVADEGRVGGVVAVRGRDGHPLLPVGDVLQLVEG